MFVVISPPSLYTPRSSLHNKYVKSFIPTDNTPRIIFKTFAYTGPSLLKRMLVLITLHYTLKICVHKRSEKVFSSNQLPNTTLSPGLGPMFKDGTLSMKNRDKWMHQKIKETRPTK